MASNKNNDVIIVKKKKGGDHGGHHGGAWKVAYADFVTAMMAFFLMLWLLNVTTEEQKQGIAQYFTPDSVSQSNTGSGQILGGTVLAPGQMQHTTGGIVMGLPQDPAAENVAEEDDIEGRPSSDQETPDIGPGTAKEQPQAEKRDVTDEDVDKALSKREEEEFTKAENELRQAIQDVPELRELAPNLIIDRTPEGLRIQIVDQDRTAMFPIGSAEPYDHTRKLMGLVARVIKNMPNKISVAGHTDSTPFSRAHANYGNWELSTDRANSSRRALLEAGLPATRINRVIGKADQEPLLADAPADPRNRRISIVLLREAPIRPN